MIRLLCWMLLSMNIVVARAQQTDDLLKYVDPFIGTERMGHTFPGATVPFGAVQLSPDTDTIPYSDGKSYNKDVYKYCAGYQHTDTTIVGFSHTHFSGTGHSDLGDILLMPTQGRLQLNPGTAVNPEAGYRSPFSHANEFAEPNYYRVLLERYQITAELTTSAHTGYHRYTFRKPGEAHIILDMIHGIYNYEGKNIWTFIRVANDSTVIGYRQTNGWARTRTVYFALQFSKRFKQYVARDYSPNNTYRGFWRKFDQSSNFPDLAGRQLRLAFDFDVHSDEQIEVKVALSPVSMHNAMLNMQTENRGWDFNNIKARGQDLWRKELEKINITATSRNDKVNFYTAMYHAALMPTLYMDVNNEYKGLDQQVHTASGFVNYTSFSLWDTHRAFHPLLNLISPARNADMVASMIAHYRQSSLKMLPIWSHYANDNWCMSGYHAVSVIADAIIKGSYRGNAEEALQACIVTATNRNYEGIGSYIDKGYVPYQQSGVSVSNTLEYAYDDWCIAQLARFLNKPQVYNEFIKRSENWRNVFDRRIGFMRPRHTDGTFTANFDVLKTEGQGFIEGNAWNYSLYVPHQPVELIELMGGRKRFSRHLDSLFSMHLPDSVFAGTEDITRDGIIGNYVHGNEPSHHVAYLYNWCGESPKTQQRVRDILTKQYHTGPSGLGGNDDCGQMSAWYIFSSLGFYPVAPASDKYWFGSPSVCSANISFENGKSLYILARNQSPRNKFVSKILLNGREIKRNYITHAELTGGGTLTYMMSARRSQKN